MGRFRFCGMSRFKGKEIIQLLDTQQQMWRIKVRDWDVTRRNEGCSYGESWSWNSGRKTNNSAFWIYPTIRIPTPGTKPTFSQWNSCQQKFSNKNFMKGKEACSYGVTEKYHFESQDKSKPIALYGFLDWQGFYCTEHNGYFLYRTVHHKQKRFDWDLIWRIEIGLVLQKSEVQNQSIAQPIWAFWHYLSMEITEQSTGVYFFEHILYNLALEKLE